MKYLKRFNEALSKADLEQFDYNDISLSLSDWWIITDEAQPEDAQEVIVYAPKSQMNKIDVCTFKRGISIKEREELKKADQIKIDSEDQEAPRRTTSRWLVYTAADEHSNNRKPYIFKVSGGPGIYFGQEVTHWMPMPSKPDSI